MSVTSFPARARPDLLFVAPGLPYPPDRGDRLRWHHMLKFLAQRFRVHFGAIVDPRTSPGELARIKALCYETCFVAPPGRLRLPAKATPLQPELAQWIACMARRFPLHAAVACSARMVPYLDLVPPGPVRVADYVDLESEKLEQRAAQRRWPVAQYGRRQARGQRTLELEAAVLVDHVLFASGAAAARFAELAPRQAARVQVLGNGVDADYFSPHILHRNPYPAGCRALVFTGALDDWANLEAAEWFAREAFAPLRAADPSLHFYVVGARPPARARQLAASSGVIVTGTVPDVRPYLAHAVLAVAPLQSAHGVQNKVLEAMAMQVPVLATPAALAGIPATAGADVLQAADAREFADTIRALPPAPALQAVGKAARARVLRDARWQGVLAPLSSLLQPPAPRHASRG
jgi:sugar transferase (PEP-CTERM/EpsH1 system associated)